MYACEYYCLGKFIVQLLQKKEGEVRVIVKEIADKVLILVKKVLLFFKNKLYLCKVLIDYQQSFNIKTPLCGQ